MKKIIRLAILISIILISCKKGNHKETFYLKIINNTSYNAGMHISSKINGEDTLALYRISDNSTKHDTSYFITGFNDGPITVESKGTNFYIGNNYTSYIFDNIKQTKFSLSRPINCDTLGTVLCNYNEIDTLRKENSNGFDYEIFYTTTYYITEQHYLLADSL